MAIAYDAASCSAMKSSRAIRSRFLRLGTRLFPAYGSIEMRPMIHASAWNVAAVRSYSRVAFGSFQSRMTIRPSIDGSMWQMTYGRDALRMGAIIRTRTPSFGSLNDPRPGFVLSVCG